MALSERDRAIIRAAAGTYREPGGELEAITYASGVSLAKSYQILNDLMGDPEAWEAEPAALGVLRRRQERYLRHPRR